MTQVHGHFSGVVIGFETETGEFHIDSTRGDTYLILVKTKNGVICYVGDWSNQLRGLHVDMHMEMEESDVKFVDGRMVYTVDEKLRCITVNGVILENFHTAKDALRS